MADTLAREVRLNGQQKRMIIVLFVVVLILLLLWARKPSNATNNVTNNKLGDLLSTPQYITYDVPGLDVPTWGHTGIWDWMQTTDCACDCSEDSHASIAPATIIETVYQYVGGPALSPLPKLDFPVYTAPPLGVWWYENGYNVHHEAALYVMTSDGINCILGKYSRSAWHDPFGRKAYPQQTKDITRNGDDAYINGRHYKHNAAKDRFINLPPEYSGGTGASFG